MRQRRRWQGEGVGTERAAQAGGGFGVQGNYTYSDAQADDPGLEIPGDSKNSGNLMDRSTRLNQDALKSLDASLALNLFRGLTFTVDGVNLTNEKIVQFATDRFRPRAVYNNGRYYFIGLRFPG